MLRNPMTGADVLHKPSKLDPAERRVGVTLNDKWVLDRLLGVGGMAAVYAATHRNGARAAIKLFPFSLTTSPEVAERFLREGYLANKINHPSVVRVLDDHLDLDGELAYLVMELLDGQTLRQKVEREGPLPLPRAIDLMVELCQCLEAAHRCGVVHRDIKPENLFVTAEGRLKVLDFGVARALDGASSTLTRSGATLGTPAYMSPEQARGRPSDISPRSDIYSAGATLLFMLSGKILHDGESAQEILVKAAWTPPIKAKLRCPELADDVAAVIDHASAFDPAHRYPDAAAFRAALESLRTSTMARAPALPTLKSSVDDTAAGVEAPVAIPDPAERKRKAPVWTAVTVVGAAGLAALLSVAGASRPDGIEPRSSIAAVTPTVARETSLPIAAPPPPSVRLPAAPSVSAAETKPSQPLHAVPMRSKTSTPSRPKGAAAPAAPAPIATGRDVGY